MTTPNTTDKETLGSRPSPRLISFAPEYFVQDGTREEYVVERSTLYSGPLVTTDRAIAEDYARRTGRTVNVRTVPVMRRVRWS